MTKIIIGFVLGVVISTIGFSGLARLADKGVSTIKQTSQDMAK